MSRPTVIICALALAPTQLVAAEWETRVGGYLNFGAGFADPLGGDDDFGVFREGELNVNGELAADNGLVFKARVEIEAFTTGDQIDENYASVSGPFGTVLIGGADTALNEHGGVGVVYPSGAYLNYYDDLTSFLPGDPGGFIGEDDSLGVRYFFTVAGFEAGVSYQPSVGADGPPDPLAPFAPRDTNDPVFEANDQYAVGARYDGAIGALAYAIGGGYLTNENADLYHLGAKVEFAGFALAGFYDRENPDGASPADLERYGVGAVHATGPWTFGGGYVLTNGMNGTGDMNFVHVGGGYALAPGVIANAAVQYGEDDNDIDGAGAFTWLSLKF